MRGALVVFVGAVPEQADGRWGKPSGRVAHNIRFGTIILNPPKIEDTRHPEFDMERSLFLIII